MADRIEVLACFIFVSDSESPIVAGIVNLDVAFGVVGCVRDRSSGVYYRSFCVDYFARVLFYLMRSCLKLFQTQHASNAIKNGHKVSKLEYRQISQLVHRDKQVEYHR